MSLLKEVARLSFPFKTPDPFIFCVYHNDQYPAGDAMMEAPRRGDGADFESSQPYRMYHGDRIPGFPQHPHRGFETITATLTGIIDHSDSQGNAGRYGHGDVQWMTAGKGIVHGEMFPLVNTDTPNPLRLYQIWLNLPAKDKMAEPCFAMHWAEDVPRWTSVDTQSSVILWAGEYGGMKGRTPPPRSWATDIDNEVAVWHIEMKPGAHFTVPAAKGGSKINRCLYWVEGTGLKIGTKVLDAHSAVTVNAGMDCDLFNPSTTATTELLMLQGRPIAEPIVQHGPFVMNTQGEIKQAFSDYQKTQFGGWPWPDDAMCFPREKGRFSLQGGREEVPPPAIGVEVKSESSSDNNSNKECSS
jgi:redox-sensitive bicupin YhaK (pirin superfamily)